LPKTIIPDKSENDPMDTEAEISIAQEYSRVVDPSSPTKKLTSKIFAAPTFTSPANKINTVEINPGVFKTNPFKKGVLGPTSPKTNLMSGVLGLDGLMSSGSKNLFQKTNKIVSSWQKIEGENNKAKLSS
jgi:hypothetical protein